MPNEHDLSGRRVVLGVTGSIAAYKAVEFASLLTKAGAEVRVILTDAAQQFVTALSFRSLTHQPVYNGLFVQTAAEPRHIDLAESAEALCIVPATANCLAKLAHGLADDLLSCVAMATRAPILLAPAMNDRMYTHPATQGNLTVLKERGVVFVGPEEGRLASGKTGTGRMAAPSRVFEALVGVLT